MRRKLVQLRRYKESHDAIRHKTDLISSATSKFINFIWTRMHLVYPLPPLLPKFCITVHSNFSWVLQSSQEKSKTVVIQFFFFFFFGGGGGWEQGAFGSMGKWWMADKTPTRALAIRGRLGRGKREGGGVRASVYFQIRPLAQASLPP